MTKHAEHGRSGHGRAGHGRAGHGRAGHGRADPGPSQRQLRVGEEIRHALAWLLERGDFRDPGLQAHPVTVTEVRMTPDLRTALVFVTPLGGGDPAPALEALTRAGPFLRRHVARAVKVKYVPTLVFRDDDSFDRAQRIDTLLHEPEVARDLAETGAETGEPEDTDGA